jgi:hypothetical protein
MGGVGRVRCTVAGHDLVWVVVIAEDPMEFAVRLGGVIDTAFLRRSSARVAVVDFTLFVVAVHPVEFRVGLLLLASSLLSIDVGVRRKEVQLLEVPVGVFE